MAKKKGNVYGVSNYHKRTPKKTYQEEYLERSMDQKRKRRPKKYKGQGH